MRKQFGFGRRVLLTLTSSAYANLNNLIKRSLDTPKAIFPAKDDNIDDTRRGRCYDRWGNMPKATSRLHDAIRPGPMYRRNVNRGKTLVALTETQSHRTYRSLRRNRILPMLVKRVMLRRSERSMTDRPPISMKALKRSLIFSGGCRPGQRLCDLKPVMPSAIAIIPKRSA